MWGANRTDSCTVWKKVYGGIWRELKDRDFEAEKVKSHTTNEKAESLGQTHHWDGNKQADILAKKAAILHPEEVSTIRQVLATRQWERTFYVHAARVCSRCSKSLRQIEGGHNKERHKME